jgi:hypothetical protein
MKLTTGILAVGLMTGGLWAQNANVITNVQNTMNGVQQQKTADSNAALGITKTPPAQPAAKAGPGAPAKPGDGKPAPNVPAKTVPMKPATAAAPALAKSAPALVKNSAVTVKPAAVALKPVGLPQAKVVAKHGAEPRTIIAAKETNPKPALKKAPAAKTSAVTAADASPAAAAPKPEEKKWAMTGKRDPFFSPVVQQPTGSGCASGKKCLEIGQINLRGVVKSENGFIAVVTNSLNKAYFLHENDPVFNGYVVRITGDAVVFQETVQDKLGKPFTREVVKRIFTPAV